MLNCALLYSMKPRSEAGRQPRARLSALLRRPVGDEDHPREPLGRSEEGCGEGIWGVIKRYYCSLLKKFFSIR